MFFFNPVNSVISQKILRSPSKLFSPHSNDILIAARSPHCDDSNHQTKILILPVFVPHSRKEPEVEVMSMDQYSPYSFKSKKTKKNQWKDNSNGEKDNTFTFAKLLENPKANYIIGNDFDLNQALMGGKVENVDPNNGGLAMMQGVNDESNGVDGKIPLLTELIVKSVLAGQKNFDWDYVGSNNSPQHSSPDKEQPRVDKNTKTTG